MSRRAAIAIAAAVAALAAAALPLGLRLTAQAAASAKPVTARSYVQDGLVAMWDESNPSSAFHDTTFLLKPEGTNSYERPHTVEFVATRKADNNWYAIKWNTADYPFLVRSKNDYPPNACANGWRSPYDFNIFQWPLGEILAVVVTVDGMGNAQVIINGTPRLSGHQIFLGTCKQATYPRAFADPKGYVHSYRLYNRALTAEEIAHNAAIDRKRFGTSDDQ